MASRPQPRPLISTPAKGGVGHRHDALLNGTNRLLDAIGLGEHPFMSVEEIAENGSSLCVAIFEALFATRIAGIVRRPKGVVDYTNNAQLTVDTLRALLPARVTIPGDITGEAIAGGDLTALAFLVALFLDLDRVIRAGGGPIKGTPADAPAPSDSRSAAEEIASHQQRTTARRGSYVRYTADADHVMASASGSLSPARPRGVREDLPVSSVANVGGAAGAESATAGFSRQLAVPVQVRPLSAPSFSAGRESQGSLHDSSAGLGLATAQTSAASSAASSSAPAAPSFSASELAPAPLHSASGTAAGAVDPLLSASGTSSASSRDESSTTQQLQRQRGPDHQQTEGGADHGHSWAAPLPETSYSDAVASGTDGPALGGTQEEIDYGIDEFEAEEDETLLPTEAQREPTDDEWHGETTADSSYAHEGEAHGHGSDSASSRDYQLERKGHEGEYREERGREGSAASLDDDYGDQAHDDVPMWLEEDLHVVQGGVAPSYEELVQEDSTPAQSLGGPTDFAGATYHTHPIGAQRETCSSAQAGRAYSASGGALPQAQAPLIERPGLAARDEDASASVSLGFITSRTEFQVNVEPQADDDALGEAVALGTAEAQHEEFLTTERRVYVDDAALQGPGQAAAPASSALPSTSDLGAEPLSAQRFNDVRPTVVTSAGSRPSTAGSASFSPSRPMSGSAGRVSCASGSPLAPSAMARQTGATSRFPRDLPVTVVTPALHSSQAATHASAELPTRPVTTVPTVQLLPTAVPPSETHSPSLQQRAPKPPPVSLSDVPLLQPSQPLSQAYEAWSANRERRARVTEQAYETLGDYFQAAGRAARSRTGPPGASRDVPPTAPVRPSEAFFAPLGGSAISGRGGSRPVSAPSVVSQASAAQQHVHGMPSISAVPDRLAFSDGSPVVTTRRKAQDRDSTASAALPQQHRAALDIGIPGFLTDRSGVSGITAADSAHGGGQRSMGTASASVRINEGPSAPRGRPQTQAVPEQRPQAGAPRAPSAGGQRVIDVQPSATVNPARDSGASVSLRAHRALLAQLKAEEADLAKRVAAASTSFQRSSEAEQLRAESETLRRATLRARSARHERRALAIHTQHTIEEMARHTLAMRLSRSSKQAAAVAGVARSMAAHARADAAERLRVEAELAAAEVAAAEAKLAMRQAAMRLTAQAALRETAAQTVQRTAAGRAQRRALAQSLSHLSSGEAQMLEAAFAEQDQAEARFLARRVEPLRGPLAGPAGGLWTGGIDPFDAADVDAYHAAEQEDDITRFARGGALHALLRPGLSGRRVHAGDTGAPRAEFGAQHPADVAAAHAGADGAYGPDDDDDHPLRDPAPSRVASRLAAASASFSARASVGPRGEMAGLSAHSQEAVREALRLARQATAIHGARRVAPPLPDDDGAWELGEESGSHVYDERFGHHNDSGLGPRSAAGSSRSAPRRVRPMAPSGFRTTRIG